MDYQALWKQSDSLARVETALANRPPLFKDAYALKGFLERIAPLGPWMDSVGRLMEATKKGTQP